MINPIIVRHARTQFRLEHVGPIMALAAYLLVLVLAFFLTYMTGIYHDSSWKDSLVNYWYELMAVQVFALVVIGSLRVAGTVVREREQKRFDFQLVTGMSPWRIAEGEMAGSTLFYYFLILCTLPFAVLCVLGGGVTWTQFGYSYLILFTGAFFFHSWALLTSSVSRSYVGSVAATLVVVALFSTAALLGQQESGTLRALSAVSPFYLPFSRLYQQAGPGQVSFFNQPFPQLFAVAVLYIFLGIWVLNGAVRKIRNPQATYISKLQAAVFTAVLLVGVSGMLAARTPAPSETWKSLFYENTAVYLVLSLLLLLVFAFMLTPSAKSYSMLIRRRIKGVWYTIFGEHSLFLVNLLILFAVSVAIYFAVFAQAATGAPELMEPGGDKMPLMDISLGFFFVLLAAFFYSLVVQLSTLLSRRAGREIAAVILLVLVLLPVLSELWSGYPETGFAQVFNPAAALIAILPLGAAQTSMNLPFAAILFYFVFCILLGALLFLRIKYAYSRLAPAVPAPVEPAAPAPELVPPAPELAAPVPEPEAGSES